MNSKRQQQAIRFSLWWWPCGIVLVVCLTANSGWGQLPPVVQAPSPMTQVPSVVTERELEVMIGDITTQAGDQTNQIWGEGLVTGLAGTGAKDRATQELILNFALNRGIPITRAESKNACWVTISGDLPAYAKVGEKFSVTVSALGDATDLRGGNLEIAELRSFDGKVYATVQGPLSVPGFSASGAGATVMKNHPTVGACMAQVVNEICLPEDLQPNLVSFNLRNKEYLTASRITSAINEVFPNSARALDKGSVEVAIPDAFQRNRIEFIAMVNQLRVRPYEPARVVINRRSGTIVMGQNVRISNVVFANENLVITTTENPVASQPAPFSDGQTVVLPRTQIQAFSESGRYNVLNSGITVHEFAAALNAMGVAPTDLINVFEAIHRQGGLHAELIFE